MASRKIWIKSALVQEAVGCKETLDALALCCMIKLTFVDSIVKDASVRRMMKIFHISYGRCVKAIDEGLKRGYLTKDGSTIRANKIREEHAYNIAFEIEVSENKGECPIGIAKMCDQLRGAVLYNHISKQNDLRDTIQMARSPKYGELKQAKKAVKRLRKKSMCVTERSAKEGLRLSYKTIASMLNVSRTKAKAIVKRLCGKGLVELVHQYERTGMTVDEFSKEIQREYSKFANRGFMVLCNGMVCLQLANAYLLSDDSLVKYIF